MIFSTDVASPGTEFVITILIVGLLNVLLSSVTGILHLFNMLTPPIPDRLTKWEQVQAVAAAIVEKEHQTEEDGGETDGYCGFRLA